MRPLPTDLSIYGSKGLFMTEAVRTGESRLRVSRRGFLKASGVSAAVAATATIGVIPFSASKAAAQQGWDAEYDVIVAGSGGAAFAAAITARANGADVVMFEKGAYVGGTTLASGGGAWFPNNHLLRKDGIEDPREDALKYMTRYSLGHLYNPEDPQYGLGDDDYALFTRYYDTSAEAAEFLEEQGAITWTYGRGYGPHFDQIQVDYQEEFEENLVPAGRSLHPSNPDGSVGYGGVMIGGYQAWAEANGIEIKLLHKVDQIITNSKGEVIGVEVVVTATAGDATPGAEASPVASTTLAVRARKGVIFGTGGYDRNVDMMRHFLGFPQAPGCAAPTNEGDLVRIAGAAGAKLGNLHNTWRTQSIFEQTVASTAIYNCFFLPIGDSYLQVNKLGKRFHNEKRNYQDRQQAHGFWDSTLGEFRNRLAFHVYDQRTQDNWGGMFPYPTDPSTTPYIITADTLDGLADAIAERVVSLEPVSGNFKLDATFKENFLAEVERFNGFATTGEDPDFRRGANRYDIDVPYGPTAKTQNLAEYPSPDQPNVAMYPLSAEGPYYAVIVGASTMGTCGGPVINADAQIVRWDGSAIEGFYGAGNCIANPNVNAYWGGGATIGQGHAWGYNAAKHAVASAEKSVD
ncbi:FAD-dependent oxidoreductase [soil metagenome]